MANPIIYDLIKELRPFDKQVAYKFSGSQRRHYEKLNRFPPGFLVFGHSICNFDPIPAQGMSIAALQAVALSACLAQGNSTDMAKRFFKQASKVIDNPWQSVIGNDLRYPETKRAHSKKVRFINWYISRLHITARKESRVT